MDAISNFSLTAQQASTMFSAVGALSSAASGFAQYKQGQAQEGAYDINSKIALQQMQDEAKASQLKYQNLIGKQRSLYAAAGVDITSGSPLLIAVDTAAQGAEDTDRIKRAGMYQSALDKYYGNMAAFSGTVGGVSTFLTGLTKSGMIAQQQKGPINQFSNYSPSVDT